MAKKTPVAKRGFSNTRTYWSYSAWAIFKECPQRYKHRYIDRMKEPSSYAMERGTDVHLKAEQYLRGQITRLPKVMDSFSDELAALKKASPGVEEWWSVTMDWKPADDSNKWILAKTDAYARQPEVLDIVDFKTGRVYPDKHALQGSLYAAMGGALHAEVTQVNVEFWYFDQGEVMSWSYTRTDLDREQAFWTEQGQRLMTADKFPATPGYQCKWCAFRSDKGGPCHAWKKA